MPVGVKYALKMKQLEYAQDILNVFYYRQTVVNAAGAQDAEALFEAFNLDVLSHWDEVVTDEISILEVEVFAIEFPTDNHQAVPNNNVGTRTVVTAERAPSWVAAGYKSNRNGAGTRSSFKRFAGLSQIDYDANGFTTAFLALAAVESLRNALGSEIESAGGSKFVPVQLKSGWTLGINPVENFQLNTWLLPVLTSQVSRKP